MKRLLTFAMTAALLALAVPTASAAPWRNQREAELDRRIDVGIHNGSLTRHEARMLHSEFNGITRLEARYRSNGLTRWERADLDRRFDVLSAKINFERHDREHR